MAGTLTLPGKASDLLEWWRDERGERAMPDVSRISPLALRRWIGDVSIMHLHDGPRRFWIALHGGNAVRHIGPDFHLKYLEDVVPEAAQAVALAPYRAAAALGVPTYSTLLPTLQNHVTWPLERMALPFAGDDGRPARFVVWVAPNERCAHDVDEVYEFESEALFPMHEARVHLLRDGGFERIEADWGAARTVALAA